MLVYFLWFTGPRGLQDLSSPTRDWTWALGSEGMSINHWTQGPKKDVLLIIGDWNAKVGSQEISGATVSMEYKMKQDEG